LFLVCCIRIVFVGGDGHNNHHHHHENDHYQQKTAVATMDTTTAANTANYQQCGIIATTNTIWTTEFKKSSMQQSIG
jgi:hypothetical protein